MPIVQRGFGVNFGIPFPHLTGPRTVEYSALR
jgi:hypothetical protein